MSADGFIRTPEQRARLSAALTGKPKSPQHRAAIASARRSHGQAGQRNGTRSTEYSIWAQAKQRVTNPNNTRWAYYGGRGIRMCREWLDSFEAFIAYIGPRPPGMSLDRINNDGHYEPGNVRWADASTQRRNRRLP